MFIDLKIYKIFTDMQTSIETIIVDVKRVMIKLL